MAQRNAAEPATHPRGDPAAARGRPGHRVRYRAGAGAAQLYPRVDSARWKRGCARRSIRSGCWSAGRRRRLPGSWMPAVPLPVLPAIGIGGEPRFDDPAETGRGSGGTAAGGRAGAGGSGQGGLPAADQPGRERRLHRIGLRRDWGMREPSATPSARSSPGRRSTWAGSRRGLTSPALARRKRRRSTRQTVLLALQEVEDVAGSLPDRSCPGGADPGRGRGERASGGAGPASVLRWRGRLPSGAGRGAHPARGRRISWRRAGPMRRPPTRRSTRRWAEPGLRPTRISPRHHHPRGGPSTPPLRRGG